MNNLEQNIIDTLPEIFFDRNRLTAMDFWKRIEYSVKSFGRQRVDGEVYYAVSQVHQQGYLRLESGCYIFNSNLMKGGNVK